MASQYDLPYTGPQVETLLAKISELESEMPSKTSDLTNDSGFITSSDVPTKTSDLNNDSGFITNAPVAAEAARAQAAEALLATISSLQAEITRATGVEGTLQDLIDGIAAKIPSAATAQNQLADKAFVNSSIATATATFRGTYNSLAELQAVSADENDYGYVRTTDEAGNTIFKRYKYASGSWVFEYDLNNSSFTASQWAAINSAITAELVEKLRALPTNAALTELLNGKQGVIADLDTIRSNATAGGTAYQKPAGGIPKSDMSPEVQSSLGKADSAVQDVSGKADKTELAALAEEVAKKANTDGYYGGMTAGSAENLVGRGSVEAEYAGIRTSAGSADIGSGSASITRMKGNSFKWNQLVQNGDFANGSSGWTPELCGLSVNDGALIISANAKYGRTTQRVYVNDNHKYILSAHIVSDDPLHIQLRNESRSTANLDKATTNGWNHYIVNATGLTSSDNITIRILNYASANWNPIYVKNVTLIDLTAIFGAGSEPATVEEFEAWLEEKGLTLDYYEHNEGAVINNRAAAIETVGFNRYNPETGKAFLPGKYSDYPQEYEICGTFTSISFRDINGNESVPMLTDGRFFNVDAPGELTVVGGNATDTLVHLVWSGWRNQGEPDYAFEPYWKNTLNLNLTTLTGKLNGEGESVVVFPNGPAKIGDVQDEIVGNKAIKRVGVVDWGNLNWLARGSYNEFYADGLGYKPNSDPYTLNITPSIVSSSKYSQTNLGVNSMVSGQYLTRTDGRFWVRDDDYSDVNAFKAAVTGVMFYYELATPEEYILDDAPQFNYRVDDFGTERVIPSYSPSELSAPIAYDVQYAMNAVDAIRRLDTNYVRRDNVKHTAGRSETDVLSQKGVDDNYAKKVGVENDLVVGAAKALAGNNRQVKEFTTMVMDGADGIAKINEVRGRSLVWNQQMFYGKNYTNADTDTRSALQLIIKYGQTTSSPTAHTKTISSPTRYDVIFTSTSSAKGVMIYHNGSSRNLYVSQYNDFVWQMGHKYYFSIDILSSDPTTVGGLVTRNIMIIDLTLMFGGNEPTTVEEFEALFNKDYYDYNPGEIISNKTASIGVTGRNVWDEEMEFDKGLGSNGAVVSESGYQVTSFIRVIPGSTYYFKSPKNSSYCCWYNENKQFVSSSLGWTAPGGTKTIPDGVAYIRLQFTGYGNTYNHNICINISDPSFNGTYEPYKHADIQLNLSTITGKLNGAGESVVIFPNGMRSAGSAYDHLIVDEDGYARRAVKRMGSVDLGTLTWFQRQTSNRPYFATVFDLHISNFNNLLSISGWKNTQYAISAGEYTLTNMSSRGFFFYDNGTYTDAATFKSAMSGVELVYELATPETYDLDEPIPMTFMAYHGGTMTQTPQAPDSAPMVINVTFAIDAVSTLIGLPEDYVSKASLQAMLSQMQSAGIIGSYTMTYNATAGRYDFTFTKPTTE